MGRLANKAEREKFLKDYRDWGVYHEMTDLKLVLYRYDFSTGAYVIVTEYGGGQCDYNNRLYIKHKFWLYVPIEDVWGDKYQNETHSVEYDPTGCGLGIIVDYMTKHRFEIEVD